MIQRLSHATIFVVDQERAKAFYTEKLGFEVKTDVTLGGFRWLTVKPKGQSELEMVLLPMKAGPMQSEETMAALRELVGKGAICPGVFATADCRKTYEELKARGVEFLSEPQERPYGIEAVFKDDSGNFYSMTQPR